MASLQDADGHLARSGPPAWGLGVWLIVFHCKKISLLQKFTMSLGFGRIKITYEDK
jgi:hypothetical protein